MNESIKKNAFKLDYFNKIQIILRIMTKNVQNHVYFLILKKFMR
jgi:hypothetical protein